ncbi:MAG: hypothetical protein J3K34DRAFT_419753 [Monoraphidium minutum]|nr:MAG: hypothetical protein J3K34DRAFT_419753 [Monoraphidium minutum]
MPLTASLRVPAIHMPASALSPLAALMATCLASFLWLSQAPLPCCTPFHPSASCGASQGTPPFVMHTRLLLGGPHWAGRVTGPHQAAAGPAQRAVLYLHCSPR